MVELTRTVTRRHWISSIVFGALLVVAAVVFRRPLVAWFTGTSTGGGGTAVTTHAGPFSIEARLDPDPPATSGNALLLEIRDGSGKPVDGAALDVAYDMPAMGAMQEMKGSAKVEHEAEGRYRARFDLPMAGSWTLTAKIRAPSGAAAQDFTLTVGTKGLSAAGASGASGAASSNPSGEATTSSGTLEEIDHYTCPMHTSVRHEGPGKCPICGMDLVPVTKQQEAEGVVMIDDTRRQLIGVRTGQVIEAPMRQVLRAVGQVVYDESNLSDVNLKVQGWITKLFVSQTGQRVTAGQPLFLFYSPELYNAQQDFLLATQGSAASSGAASAPGGRLDLGRAARQRLHLLGLGEAQIDQISKKGAPLESVAIASPASGFVIEKNVVQGASVDPGMRLYRIAALGKVWVEADVYEGDVPSVHVGQSATVTLDFLPGRSYEATVGYVYPYLDPKARTGRVRFELANKDLDLRPGMYARVELASNPAPRVQVPASAVVYTGPRRLVFVDLGMGRFRPQEIRVGAEANGMYEVLSGLKPGDMVATSGVFLIAAEARIRTAATYWNDSGDGSGSDRPREAVPDPSAGVAPAPADKTPAKAAAPASSSAAIIYTCPMHPEIERPKPGKCPICGMDLVPKSGGGGK